MQQRRLNLKLTMACTSFFALLLLRQPAAEETSDLPSLASIIEQTAAEEGISPDEVILLPAPEEHTEEGVFIDEGLGWGD